MDFTYKREYDNQRGNMLSALEIIESLKSNMIKADESESVAKKNIEKKNPSFSALQQAEENIRENKLQINQTYDNHVIMTEKDIDRSKDIRFLNNSNEFNFMKTNQKNIKKNDKNNFLEYKNITAINSSLNTNENNYMEINNTYEGDYYSKKDKKVFNNNNSPNSLKDIKSMSP